MKFRLLNAHSIGNKATNIAAVIDEGCYDVFLLTENWQTASEDVPLRRYVLSSYICFDVSGPTTGSGAKTNHGGIAAIISDQLKYKLVSPSFHPKAFESVCFSVTGSTSTVMVLLIYRPGSVASNRLFFKELTLYLEVLVLYKCQVIVAGDFNIHRQRSPSANDVKLQDIIDSFGCIQHVSLTPTHRDGGTLDLVLTKSEQDLDNANVEAPNIRADHSLISCHLQLTHQPPIISDHELRSWKVCGQGQVPGGVASV